MLENFFGGILGFSKSSNKEVPGRELNAELPSGVVSGEIKIVNDKKGLPPVLKDGENSVFTNDTKESE